MDLDVAAWLTPPKLFSDISERTGTKLFLQIRG